MARRRSSRASTYDVQNPRNHSTTLSGVQTCAPSADAKTPGGVMSGGSINQNFSPSTHAFHALVPLGSWWKTLPDLRGPTMSHRWSGRRAPSSAKRSSLKGAGVSYAPSAGAASAKRASKRYSGWSLVSARAYAR